jgi:hypothetical protein
MMNGNQFDPWQQEWTGYVAETKILQYGQIQSTLTYSMGTMYLYPIKNLNLIISQNTSESTKNTTPVTGFGSNANQIAVAKTLRAYYYMSLSDILGPLPYSEAFKGDDGNFTPKFDTQAEIYKALDAELQEASKQFDTSSNLTSDDIIYGGNVAKWKKFNATLRMMMAIKMADVDPTNGKTRFAAAYADGGMESNSDSFSYTYQDNQYSPFYIINNASYSPHTYGVGPNEVIVNYLKEYKDNRLFKYFDLNSFFCKHYDMVGGKWSLINADTLAYGKSAEMDAKIDTLYYGIPFGPASSAIVIADAKKACAIAQTPYSQPKSTYPLISYARCKLVEAEAAELGWISADANALYEAGITASFDFIGASGLEDYLASAKVKLSSDKATALKQIVTQRFLAGFLTDGVEAWSDWRRYNIPVLPVNAGAAAQGVTVYPYRLQFDTDDINYNKTNYTEGIKDLSGGKDDRWSRVWWDTADNK